MSVTLTLSTSRVPALAAGIWKSQVMLALRMPCSVLVKSVENCDGFDGSTNVGFPVPPAVAHAFRFVSDEPAPKPIT